MEETCHLLQNFLRHHLYIGPIHGIKSNLLQSDQSLVSFVSAVYQVVFPMILTQACRTDRLSKLTCIEESRDRESDGRLCKCDCDINWVEIVLFHEGKAEV